MITQKENEDLSEEEKKELSNLTEKFKKINEAEEEMYREFYSFKRFYEYNKRFWYDSVINSRKEKYPSLLDEKLKVLKSNYEHLKERYKQETRGNAIYARKETRGFKEWKLELTKEEIMYNNSHETKELWAKKLEKHINEVSEEDILKEVKKELNRFSYPHLRNIELQNAFKNYYTRTGKYPNWSTKITRKFIKWIENVENELSQEILKNLCNIINEDFEITTFICEKIKKSGLSLTKISKEVKNLGLSISHKTIGKIALEEVFNGNQEEYNRRFSANLDLKRQIETLRGIEFREKDYPNLINPEFKKGAERYINRFRDMESHEKYPNIGTKLSNKFIKWIEKNVPQKDKERIMEICAKIDNNLEIAKFIFDKIQNTDLSLTKISNFLSL